MLTAGAPSLATAPPGLSAGLTVLAVVGDARRLEEVRALLHDDQRVDRVLTAEDARDALRALDTEDVDAVFLDVELRDGDGLGLARHVLDHRCASAVVVVTARGDAAVDAFAVGALDYLLLPLRADRLGEALRRVSAIRAARQPAPSDALAVELGGVTRWVSAEDVHWAQAAGDYTRLHTSGSSHLVRMPISVLEQRWRPFGFVRIHRSHLVSAQHVAELRTEPSGAHAVRVADLTLRVSRRYAQSLKDRLTSPGAYEGAERGT